MGERRRVRGSMEAGIVTVLLGALSGCGLTTGTEDPFRFDLVRFDGEALPTPAPFGQTVVAGHFLLDIDGSCERVIRFSPTGNAGEEEAEDRRTCEWDREGDRLTLTFPEDLGGPFGPIGNTSGTIDEEGLTLDVQTGIVCVTTPCPTGWSEEYERSNDP